MFGVTWSLDNGEHPHEAHYLKLDCSKAKMRMNWQPRFSLDTTLSKIVTWHKAWLAGENMHERTVNEISHYVNTQYKC
jgi:CDP-glucose 4,6-dehydratase